MPILSISIIPPRRWCWHDTTSVPCNSATGIPVYHVIIMLSTYIPPLGVYIICTYDTPKNYVKIIEDIWHLIFLLMFRQLHGAHCFAIHVGGEPHWELGLVWAGDGGVQQQHEVVSQQKWGFNMILSDRNDGTTRIMLLIHTEHLEKKDGITC